MNNPVMQAINSVKVAEREDVWQRNEAALLAALIRQFGEMPIGRSPAMDLALSAFINWCQIKNVRNFPASPAAIAQFILENASLGIDAVSEVVDHLADVHEAAGLANPVATWIVSEALDRVSSDTEAPRSWPAEHKWRFTQLPCVLRRYLVRHDKQREQTVRRSQNEAALAKQRLAAFQKSNEVKSDVDTEEIHAVA